MINLIGFFQSFNFSVAFLSVWLITTMYLIVRFYCHFSFPGKKYYQYIIKQDDWEVLKVLNKFKINEVLFALVSILSALSTIAVVISSIKYNMTILDAIIGLSYAIRTPIGYITLVAGAIYGSTYVVKYLHNIKETE